MTPVENREQLVAVATEPAAAADRCREAVLSWGGPVGSRRIASG